jgi:hypothetical protein
VVPVVPVPVAPAPERVVPVPDVSDSLLTPEPVLPEALLPDVPGVDEPLVSSDDPLVPEVDEPLVEADEPLVEVGGAAPSMQLVELGGVLSVTLAPLAPVLLVPDVVPCCFAPCCFDLVDLSFFVSLDLCWSLPEVGELVVCAATPALTNRAVRITAIFLFMSFLLLLVGAYGELPFWHRRNASHVGECAVRQSELPQAK